MRTIGPALLLSGSEKWGSMTSKLPDELQCNDASVHISVPHNQGVRDPYLSPPIVLRHAFVAVAGANGAGANLMCVPAQSDFVVLSGCGACASGVAPIAATE